MSGTVDVDPRIDLRLEAAPNPIVEGETALLTADVNVNFDGAVISPGILDGLPVGFAADALASVSPATDLLSGGQAFTTLTGLFAGVSTASATLDNGNPPTEALPYCQRSQRSVCSTGRRVTGPKRPSG